jgi:hypothetical protein
MLPELAKGPGNTFWVIPSEVTSALQSVTKAFTGETSIPAAVPSENGHTPEIPRT